MLPVVDSALLDFASDIAVYGFFGRAAFIFARSFAPTQQADIVKVGVLRCVEAGAGRVIRSGPTFFDVPKVAQHIEILLPAGRTGIERLSATEFHTRNHKMQFVMIGMTVAHP